jgi:hypothetical protein
MDILEKKKISIKCLGFHKIKPASEKTVKLRFRNLYGKWPTENELRQFKISNPIISSF